MPTVRPSEPALAPDRIGPYRLLRPISAGGMARVYEGRFDSLAGVSTRVAVKVIHPDFANESGFQDLFIQEARISARLEHLNVVRVQQFNKEGQLYYLVMEYIEGITFRKIVTGCTRHNLRLPPALLAELGRQACEGLQYAHALLDDGGQPLRLVHRDMKPSNLMLNVHGVVKVLDFGISSAHGQPEAGGAVKGTWGYMAPEQAEGGDVGPAADLFGLASVLFEVASLRPLFPEEEPSSIRRALATDEAARRAASLGGAQADLAGVLVRALQRDPAARYRSAEAMGRALGALVADPMSARDELVRFVAELRRLDSPGAAPVADASASSASVSTMGPGGLPLVTGSMHAPRAAAPKKPAAPKKSVAGALVSVAFALASIAVLGFTAWRLFAPLTRPTAPAPRVPAAAAEAVTTAPGPEPVVSATPVSAPAPVVAPPPVTAVTPEPAPPGETPHVPEAPHHAPASPSRTAGLVASLEATESAPAAPPVRAEPAPSPLAAEGTLSISATPRAQVMVDGQYVRYTPLFQHGVAAGPHTVLLVTNDGRRKTFKVDVAAGVEVRRIWLFDENRWSDEAAAPP